jgi:hypothetical protein
MTIFHAKEAVDSVKASHTERQAAKATKEAQHFATSPFGQRLIEENKQLRSAVRRISALEKRMDDTEAWQAEAQPRIQRAENIAPAMAVMGLDHHEDCPCNRDIQWTGIRRCFHCTKSFDSHDMAAHTAEMHHG